MKKLFFYDFRDVIKNHDRNRLEKYLKEKYGVTYVSMMKRLDISREQMNSLTKK